MPSLPHDLFERSLKRFWDLDPLPFVQTIRAAKPQGAENQLAVLYLLSRVSGVTDALWRSILDSEVVKMSDVYEEIMELGAERGRREGLQKGRREGLLQAVARLLARRFPANCRGLDDLLVNCSDEELDWIVGEAISVQQFATLRKHLLARLNGR